jgi:peptide/nickel transport system ATP-binding protein
MTTDITTGPMTGTMIKSSGIGDTPVLDVQHLYVDYASEHGVVHAVTDVSLTLRRGEVLGLAGESGSGKSTLAYAIARLLPGSASVTAGEVLYYPSAEREQAGTYPAGVPVDVLDLFPSDLRQFRWSDLAIVFQSAMNALNPVMTIATQIDDVLRAHQPQMRRGARKQRARELLRLVGIAPDRLGSYPHELSGGMRQRAAIALALALAPEIIIMDEPTTALDVVVQREILGELLRLRQRLQFAVIFITHDLSLLLELADRIAIMYAGRIVEQATQRDLYRTPCHPYSYGLINSFPRLHGPRRLATGIPGSPPDLRTLPSGCAYHPRCPLAFAPCQTVVPQLRPIAAGSDQLVACHLYDPAYRPSAPDTAEIAAAYEGSIGRSRA